jgi:uncharacterized protein YcaQ
MPHIIDRAVARRFLAIRHLLAPPRALPGSSEGVLAVIDRLGSLQFDPLEVAGRNHDLVLHARVAGYSREITDELLYGRRLLFEEYNKSLNLLPTRELPYYRITWRTFGSGRAGQLLAEQAPLAARILESITTEGPKSSSDFERSAAIGWWWGPTSAVRAVLEALSVSGRLGLARRDGNRRYYDLTERLFPADLLEVQVPEREQLLHKLLSRYRAHGLLGSSGSGELWLGIGKAPLRNELRAELLDRGEITQVAVEGMRGERYLLTDELPLLVQAERESAAESAGADPRSGDGDPGCAFLAPLDPLMWDRSALEPLYGFDYRWEVYTPAAKRRWGYYVLPILFGDRLVGRIEPRIDRSGKVVRILGLGWEAGFEPLAEAGFVGAFAEALNAYLAFGAADSLVPAADRAHRPLFDSMAGSVRMRANSRRSAGGGATRAVAPARPRAGAGAGAGVGAVGALPASE